MIIVRILGGLGNQMFQYALYRSLKEKGKNVKIDISGFSSYGLHSGYELPKIFNIKENIASKNEIEQITDDKNDIFNKVRRRFFGRKQTHYFQKEFRFIPELLDFDTSYLDGYWQSEKYFIDIESVIRKEFHFINELDYPNKEITEKIRSSNSVSIHIRRGDYVSDSEASKVHGGITTLAYYKKAIETIKEKVDSPVFFIFSDDMKWVKENMNLTNCYFIDWNKGPNSYRDMQLMSYCKHNIIANSSFSWWGAWLNNNHSKIVIGPNKWFNTIEAKDVISDKWFSLNISEL